MTAYNVRPPKLNAWINKTRKYYLCQLHIVRMRNFLNLFTEQKIKYDF